MGTRVRTRRRRQYGCEPPLAPLRVGHHDNCAHKDGKQDADRSQRLVCEARHHHGDAGMTRYRGVRQHRPLVFVRSPKQMTGGKPKERDDSDRRERTLAHHRAHQ